MNFYTGVQPRVDGFVMVIFLGELIAMVDSQGAIVMRKYDIPIYLVEYLLLQPRVETTQWN
jgi:hypothetical protein